MQKFIFVLKFRIKIKHLTETLNKNKNYGNIWSWFKLGWR